MAKKTILEITQFGNPILRKKAKQVPLSDIKRGKYRKLTTDMFVTMRERKGVGLAAPQVNKAIQLTVIAVPPNTRGKELRPTVVFNPKITRYSRKKEEDWEGCLSLPEVRAKVPRSAEIDVRYYNEAGEQVTKSYKNFHARVFQHEIDHLNGILFIDRMTNMTSMMTTQEFEKRILKKK